MVKPPPARPFVLALLITGASFLVVFIISNSEWITVGIGGVILIASALIALTYLRSIRNAHLISSLYESEKSREKSIATGILAEILGGIPPGVPRLTKVAELVCARFGLGKLAIFFHDGDKFVPRFYHNIPPAALNRPRMRRLQYLFKGISTAGKLSADDGIRGMMLKKSSQEIFEPLVTFRYKWGRSRLMILIAEDKKGLLTDSLNDPDFNEIFWPALDNHVRQSVKLADTIADTRRMKSDLSRAKREILDLNKDLNKKLIDLQSYVKISSDLYSHFSEEQLFESLKKTVCTQVGAKGADIMHPAENGEFVARSADGSADLVLDPDSKLLALIEKSAKPLLLPVAGSGMRRNEPFLRDAIGRGYEVALAIRAENKTGCILIIREKIDKGHYSDLNLDFLSIVSNIASLALENIRQYSTIEKLSYTDSMTGVFNYRYFYKRLNEEILRAKRYNRDLALVILDIDNFKLFNDNYGHQTGDFVLKRLAEIITRTVRSIDIVSRYGGEEFCIIMPDTNAANCEVFIERLRAEIARFKLESDVLKRDNVITVSVGGAIYPQHASTPDRIIYCADMALLRAKASGRNRAIMCRPEFINKEESSIGGRE
jgi:diguanylate cyclase (GGDEF)-like protein